MEDGQRPEPSGSKPEDPSWDLATTNPLEDLWHLFTKPNRFFAYFKGKSSGEFPGWVWGKLLFSFFFIYWVSLIIDTSSSSGNFQFSFNSHSQGLDPAQNMFIDQFLSGLGGLEGIERGMQAAGLAFTQLFVLSAPFFALLHAWVFAKVAHWGVGLVGADRKAIHWKQLFILLLYAELTVAFAIIPGVGLALRVILPMIFFLLALRAVTGLALLRAFLASYVVFYAAMTAVSVACAIVFFIFIILGGFFAGAIF